MTILSGFADALVPEIQEITKERRRKGRPEEKFKADIFSALKNASMPGRVVQPDADQLEKQAAIGRFGRTPDLNQLIGQSSGARRVDESKDFLSRLAESGIGGVSSEGITFRQPGTDISTLLTAMLLGQNQGGQQNPPPTTPPPIEPPVSETMPRGEGFTALPVVNRVTGLARDVGRGIGAREMQRGITQSLQARATPALKALGEVGVLTDQDVARILGGGFASDSDTVESRFAKKRGMMATFDEKEKVLNNVLSQPLVPQLQSFGSGGRGGNVRYAYPPEQVQARKKAQEQLMQLKQARNLMTQIFEEADRDMPAIGASASNQPSKLSNGVSYTVE